MCKKLFFSVLVLSLTAAAVHAGQIDLKALGINADFDDWLSVGNDGAKWASEITNTDLNGDGVNDIYDAILQDDEFYTNPSSFGSGWQSNGTAGLNGKYGLGHPKKSAQNDMSAPFNGDFIGFVNMDDADGLSQSIQSAIVGNLVPGTYTLTVAVGARPSTSWNDVRYEISLVANPVLAAPDNGGPASGSRDGTVLGVPATVTLVPATAVLGSNNQDLVYTLAVDANDPNVGAPFAIRIATFNALQQDGVPDDGTNGGTVDPGTNYRFVQGNFDNVRLTVESATLPMPEQPEEEKALVNGSFEEPAAGQAGFDNVPGWSTSAAAANSGIRADPNATDGAQVAYLGGGDPAISQMSSLVCEPGKAVELKLDARNAAGAASLQITLYVELFGTPLPVTTQAIPLTDVMAEYTVTISDVSAFAGYTLGVDLANAGGPDTSLVLDNVRLNAVGQ
jgi:hypothetical protein